MLRVNYEKGRNNDLVNSEFTNVLFYYNGLMIISDNNDDGRIIVFFYGMFVEWMDLGFVVKNGKVIDEEEFENYIMLSPVDYINRTLNK